MIKLFSMFSGYGGAEFALQKAGIDFETVGYSEIDKYAIQCYNQNHCKDTVCNPDGSIYKYENPKNYGDATKINEKELPDFDLLTGSFPCQSFSVAGKSAGTCDSRGTLFWDILRVAKEKKPKYMLLENVKGLTNKTHRLTFERILYDLANIGYHVYWKVLNSKDYGIPQNRERVWFVCIRADLKQEFEFPEKTELNIFLKDILEDEVDDGICKPEIIVKKIKETVKVRKHVVDVDGLKKLLISSRKKTMKEIAEHLGVKKTKVEHWFRNDNSFAIPDEENWIKLKEFLGIKDNSFDKSILEFEIRDGTFDMAKRVYSPYGISPTITTITGGKQLKIIDSENGFRLMSPTECFRLMGFLDDGINLEGLSNTQKYKLAGNGWEINVVSKILKNLIK